ncbi:MAG: dynamin family protein [Anaerolineae bacterium]|nr:dynamin family protein [Anaerolineae bacterium]
MQDTPVVEKPSTPTLEGTLAALRESEIRLLSDIGETIAGLGEAAAEDRRRLLDVAQDLRDMFFLVVVIGEFNAGKSSFVNALLADDLLPSGITPTTEQIELVRYADSVTRKPEVRLDGIRVWTHPNTGAPGVALVDTPGTGSVFQKHEQTAKAFLHRADLVIFVISAKRAFADTERLYLELAKHYGKKIILVVNQVDLLQPNELQEVRRFIERQADETLNMRPLIFMVSAREALNAIQKGGIVTGDPGGIEAVRAHLRGVLNQAPPARQKLVAQLEMAHHLVTTHLETVQRRADLVTADTNKVRDVQREMEQQSTGLNTQLKAARAEVDAVFAGMRQRGVQFINENLSIRSILRNPDRNQLQSQFQEVVIGRALRDISGATNGYINAVVDSSRLYWRGVIERLNQLRDLMDQEVSGLDAGVYAEQRQNLQDAIRVAEVELQSYSSGKLVAELQDIFETNMNAFRMSAVAAIGGVVLTLLAIAAPGGVIGAGVAATVTLAFVVGVPLGLIGGGFAFRYYQKTVGDARKDLNSRVDTLEKTYHDSLDNLTQKERNRLSTYGAQFMTPIFSRLEVLADRYTAQGTRLRAHLDQIKTLRAGIEGTP